MLADGRVIAEQDPVGLKGLLNRGNDIGAAALEPGREELDHRVRAVAVHDEGREAVGLGVHHAVGGRVDRGATGMCLAEASCPPGRVHRLVPSAEQPQANFGGRRVEGAAEVAVAGAADSHHAWLLHLRLAPHVAAVDPGVAALPAARPPRRDDNLGRHACQDRTTRLDAR